mgnify:CR=1 FL=1
MTAFEIDFTDSQTVSYLEEIVAATKRWNQLLQTVNGWLEATAEPKPTSVYHDGVPVLRQELVGLCGVRGGIDLEVLLPERVSRERSELAVVIDD